MYQLPCGRARTWSIVTLRGVPLDRGALQGARDNGADASSTGTSVYPGFTRRRAAQRAHPGPGDDTRSSALFRAAPR